VKDLVADWKLRKPDSTKERSALFKACGDKCFISPKDLKYPICSKDNTCKIDCVGLRAARNLAAILSNSSKIKAQAKETAIRVRSDANLMMQAYCA
jgi:hypothetical protein